MDAIRSGAARRPRRAAAVVALAAAWMVSGCASPIGTTASSFLHRVRESPDPNLRHLAYSKLADPNCYDSDDQRAEAASELAARLDARKEPLVTRAVICRTLGELRRPEGREALRRACDEPDPILRAAACRALGKIGHPDDALVLARVMGADTDADCRVAAIEGLGSMEAGDPRILQVLVDGMENPDPGVRLASYQSLQRITGRDLGPDVAPWRAMVGATGEAPPVDAATVPAAAAGVR
jgi:HEAT repeat protein